MALTLRVICTALIIHHVSATASTVRSRLTDTSMPTSYCEWETFRPNCSRGEVIVMKSAHYGRMRLGRCVEAGLGFLGCSADVLHLADAKCSGRQECEVSIPDKEFDATRPCNKEVKVYLEASYSCLRVVDSERGCSVVVSSSGTPSYILSSSVTSSVSRCGTRAQPWKIEAEPGQRMILTLIDFGASPAPSPPPAAALDGTDVSAGDVDVGGPRGRNILSPSDVESVESSFCTTPYAFIVDSDATWQVPTTKNLTLCGGGPDREREVYRSEGHLVQFEAASVANNFVLRVEAIGCADLRQPSDAWLKRDGDDLVVGCHSTSQTWHLRCVGRRWNGVVGNCTIHMAGARKEALVNRYEETLPHILTIAMVAGIALTLSTVIVCTGIFCFRHYARQERIKQQYAVISAADKLYTDTAPGPDTASRMAAYSRSTDILRPATDYMHVWQLPLPQPEDDTTSVAYRSRAQAMTSSGKSDCAYSIGSIDSRYFVLDHNHSSALPVANDSNEN